jgi:hypothetical protein
MLRLTGSRSEAQTIVAKAVALLEDLDSGL